MKQLEKTDKSDSWAFVALGIGLFLTIILPPVLTGKLFNLSIINFSDTGQIGDTIGGIVGPILNFTGLILVYFSFKQQFVANQLQREALEQEIKIGRDNREFSRATDLIKELKEELSRLKFKTLLFYSDTPKEIESSGSEAIWRFSKFFECEQGKPIYIKDAEMEVLFLNKFYNIAMLFEMLIEKFRDYPFEAGDRRIIQHQLKTFYVIYHFPYMAPLKEAIKRKNTPTNEFKQAFMIDLIGVIDNIDVLALQYLYKE